MTGWWSIPGSGYTVMRMIDPYRDFCYTWAMRLEDGQPRPCYGHDAKTNPIPDEVWDDWADRREAWEEITHRF